MHWWRFFLTWIKECPICNVSSSTFRLSQPAAETADIVIKDILSKHPTLLPQEPTANVEFLSRDDEDTTAKLEENDDRASTADDSSGSCKTSARNIDDWELQDDLSFPNFDELVDILCSDMSQFNFEWRRLVHHACMLRLLMLALLEVQRYETQYMKPMPKWVVTESQLCHIW